MIRIDKGYPVSRQMNGAVTVHIRGLSECIGMKKGSIGAQMSCSLTRLDEKRGRVAQPPVDAYDPTMAGLRRVRRSEHGAIRAGSLRPASRRILASPSASASGWTAWSP
ncbi:hypothetical protein [Paenirhodobacter sp.]|uniref:hypothetical protein n=1 Tax=Paenirhodobacter sp. TaxID=1965326 RepID=UPI003B50D852